MSLADYAEFLGPGLFAAIERKGYAELTAVQKAVLEPTLAGRDLRITSQTGSGKTLAIGLTLRSLVDAEAPAGSGAAHPRALIVAPTRELAHQVEQELSWLYAGSTLRLATTTGGASYRDEHRALSKRPDVVVGTPGRLLDHLERGTIDPSQVATVVLDEADRMLELGFREDLETLFKRVPETRATHLVSATFPRLVRSLADRLQRNPAHVEGTQLGAANADIDHVIYVVDQQQRLDALINLLLAYPDDQTLVFVRTRADAGHIANTLIASGFAASALSGEMEQSARNRTIAAYRDGGLRILIATDVAARGIDVPDVSRVVHGELPTNTDAYTHRAGRTGRAGRKGTSVLLVAPSGVVRATRLLRSLGAPHRIEAVPSAKEIVKAQQARAFEELTRSEDLAAEAERWRALAAQLTAAGEVERTMMRLLAKAHSGVTEPRDVRVFPVRVDREAKPWQREREREPRGRVRGEREPKYARGEREPRPAPSLPGRDHDRDAKAMRPPREPPAARPEREHDARTVRSERTAKRGSVEREAQESPQPAGKAAAYTSFHVSWGQRSGADPRRVLAMVCRRGNIRGRDVGAIRIEPNFSLVDVASDLASDFARAAGRPDPREPEVVIRIDRAKPAAELDAVREKVRRTPPPRAAGGYRQLQRRRTKAR